MSPNEFGIVTLAVGEADPLLFAAIDWGHHDHFLKVEMDSGSGYMDMGDPTEILSAPYAIFSQWAGTDNDWIVDGSVMYHNNGYVGIGTDSPSQPLDVQSSDLDAYFGVIRGEFTGTNSDDGIGVLGQSIPTDYYGIGGAFYGGWRGVQGVVNPTGDDYYTGVYGSVNGGTGTNYAVYGTVSGGTDAYAGYFSGNLTATGVVNLGSSTLDGASQVNFRNSVSIYDGSNVRLHYWNTTSSDAAYAASYGPNGAANIIVSNLSGNGNHGYFGVCDASGNLQAGMYVNSSGEGVLFKDVDNFRMDHPEDPDKEIWYAALEGPEAGAYERGVAQLDNGAVFVPYSDHFTLVINPETVTVILTPHSAETYGLAVVEKTETGFWVKELMNGNGDFSFDWEAKGVRAGFEEYEVIRDRLDFLPEKPADSVVLPENEQAADPKARN